MKTLNGVLTIGKLNFAKKQNTPWRNVSLEKKERKRGRSKKTKRVNRRKDADEESKSCEDR